MEQTEEKPEAEKTIQAPDFCKFQKDELIPLKGYVWQVLGYTDDFMLVLKCRGLTANGKHKKAN
jgi:hypothetical protein